ncbi:DNA-repair protein XRCC1 isoform X2 [Syzygium oleosum]|uniref:DNA-repair protein XRCC1 isoform X2 n=1 Tax=Syzygium oleosum TaxID=219896 RepID=UPI0011D1BF79|nr:DNA-repair protein XRCC1 isoform X2 [Syzygium oleosum]
MPNSKSSPSDGGNKTAKRSLPSWITSKHKGSSQNGKNAAGSGEDEDTGENGRPEQAKGLDGEHASSTLAKKSESSGKPSSSSLDTLQLSELLEGVVFVLSGFVNPERSTLRSQALEMGAEYQPDWNSDCTLLICAFQNTPKFRQVEANNGTIVAKEWITECYTQRKLVDIESYLMHAGKPWRRRSISDKSGRDSEVSPSRGYPKHAEKRSQSRQSTAASSKKANSNVAEDLFNLSKVKSWAIIDLNRTTTWLESQEEKPPADEIKKIAAEGILTCLQDAIDALEQNQDVQRISEQWNIVPRVMEELIKLEGSGNTATTISHADLHRKAVDCKQIYEAEYSLLESDASMKQKKPRTDDRKIKGKKEAVSADAAAGYDSDETMEMTEEEIELAYNTVAAKVPEF